MNAAEIPVAFPCGGATLLGILHRPETPLATGILVVVGGPQYRIGSHRQFLLLARAFAEAGIATMRFDYRGMGDSDGAFAGFEYIDADIAAAIDAFQANCPGVRNVVLWGLCDAASAILFYAHRDRRIGGIVILNPWVRTPAGVATAYLRHYYGSRFLQRQFWQRLFTGKLDILASARSLASFLRVASQGSAGEPAGSDLPTRMAAGLSRYGGPVLLVVSGQDLTAREFEDAAACSPVWRKLMSAARLTRCDLSDADHTFSRRAWREQVAAWTREWLDRNGMLL
jgi:uncharacterized protein